MLIKFSLRNYKAFRDPVEWSLIASADTSYEESNVVQVPVLGLRLLKTAMVYGANASGKTRLLQAMDLMKSLVREFSKSAPGESIPVEPFRLNSTSATESSEFEVTFLFMGVYFRYGFELTSSRVVAEWLFRQGAEEEKEIEIFYRDAQEIELPAQGGPQLHRLREDKIVRENELLLPKAAQYNSFEATQVWNWFRNFNVITALDIHRYSNLLVGQLRDPERAAVLLELIKAADLSIKTAEPDIIDVNNLPAGITAEAEQRLRDELARRGGQVQVWRDILTQHVLYDDEHRATGEVWFRLNQEESHGTRQFFTLMALVVDTLAAGGILAVDELTTGLHPQ